MISARIILFTNDLGLRREVEQILQGTNHRLVAVKQHRSDINYNKLLNHVSINVAILQGFLPKAANNRIPVKVMPEQASQLRTAFSGVKIIGISSVSTEKVFADTYVSPGRISKDLLTRIAEL